MPAEAFGAFAFGISDLGFRISHFRPTRGAILEHLKERRRHQGVVVEQVFVGPLLVVGVELAGAGPRQPGHVQRPEYVVPPADDLHDHLVAFLLGQGFGDVGGHWRPGQDEGSLADVHGRARALDLRQGQPHPPARGGRSPDGRIDLQAVIDRPAVEVQPLAHPRAGGQLAWRAGEGPAVAGPADAEIAQQVQVFQLHV